MQMLYFLLPLNHLLESNLGNWLPRFCGNFSRRQTCLCLRCRSVIISLQFFVTSAICAPSAFRRGVGLRPWQNTVLGDFVRPLGIGEQLALNPFDNRFVRSGRDWLCAATLPYPLPSPNDVHYFINASSSTCMFAFNCPSHDILALPTVVSHSTQ